MPWSTSSAPGGSRSSIASKINSPETGSKQSSARLLHEMSTEPSEGGGSSLRVHIHDRGDPRLDGVLRLLDKASRPGPIDRVLQELCDEVARIAPADVASVYVREEEADGRETLVMRANVGFPAGAVGNVRLEVGEGITGFVAECLRPVSVATAPGDAHYKHVPGLGEEKFPSFLAVPLLLDGSACGVLVLQRRESLPFAPSEVTLATCLTTPFVYAI